MKPNLPPDYDPRVSCQRKNAGSPMLYLYYYLPNGERLIVSAKTKLKTLGSQIAKEKEKRLLAGEFTDEELKRLGASYGSRELTIQEAVDRYLQITSGNKSAKTIQGDKWSTSRIFVDYFAKKRGVQLMRDITPAMINDFLHGEISTLSQATRHTYRRAIRKVFNTLIREGSLRGDNPVARAEPVPLAKRQAQRSTWIPLEQFQLLLAAAKTSRSPLNFHDMLELNWEVALRRDEMLTLEWHQVDLDKGLLHIVEKPNFPTMFGVGWAPKWHQERTLVLTEKAMEILRRQPKRLTAGTVGKKSEELAPCSLVFPRRASWKGEVRYLRCDCIKTAWLNLLKDAKLTGYCWHDMRRSWNRYAAERGIPTAYRAAFLGHRIEVNEGSYETAMGIEFLRSKLGRSLAELPTGVDPVLIQLASSGQTVTGK